MTEWRAVVGYEGLYEVSDDGQVRSLPRRIPSSNRFASYVRSWPGRLMRLTKSKRTGYPTVQLCRDGRVKLLLVHRLVCEAFNGPCPDGWECAHSDGSRDNNNATNLRWATSTENQGDRREHGTANRGDNAHQSVLKASDIPTIRARRRAGETYKAIAQDYGVHLSTVHYACSGKNWAAVE